MKTIVVTAGSERIIRIMNLGARQRAKERLEEAGGKLKHGRHRIHKGHEASTSALCANVNIRDSLEQITGLCGTRRKHLAAAVCLNRVSAGF